MGPPSSPLTSGGLAGHPQAPLRGGWLYLDWLGLPGGAYAIRLAGRELTLRDPGHVAWGGFFVCLPF